MTLYSVSHHILSSPHPSDLSPLASSTAMEVKTSLQFKLNSRFFKLCRVHFVAENGKCRRISMELIVGFTLETTLVWSNHLIQLHLKIVSRPVENMVWNLLTKYKYYLKYKLPIIFRAKTIYAYHNRDCSSQKLKPWGLCAGKECFVVSYLLFATLTQRILSLKEMLTYFVFYEYLATAQKITTTNDIFCISLEWLNNALFVKEIAVELVLGLFSNAFS